MVAGQRIQIFYEEANEAEAGAGRGHGTRASKKNLAWYDATVLSVVDTGFKVQYDKDGGKETLRWKAPDTAARIRPVPGSPAAAPSKCTAAPFVDEACTKCLGTESTKNNQMILCDYEGCSNGVR